MNKKEDVELVYERFRKYKIDDCLGCCNNNPSQQYHDCHTDYVDDYYFQKAIQQLILEGAIDKDFQLSGPIWYGGDLGQEQKD